MQVFHFTINFCNIESQSDERINVIEQLNPWWKNCMVKPRRYEHITNGEIRKKRKADEQD